VVLSNRWIWLKSSLQVDLLAGRPMVQVGALSAIHALVTDAPPPAALAAALAAAGIELRKASSGS
jgi:hypothetical protein